MRPSRRRFLRGVGSALLLPPLASLTRDAHASSPRRRFVQVFAPNGAVMSEWTPPLGALQLTPGLAGLAPVQDAVTVFSGLDLPNTVEAAHHARMRSLLTERLDDTRFGASLDQVLAPVVSQGAPLSSIQLTCQAGVSCGSTECGWLGVSSWQSETTPTMAYLDVPAAFARLFGGHVGTPAETDRRRSVLDAVLADAAALREQLSGADRQQLERHLDEVRALETRLVATEPAAGCPPDAIDVEATIQGQVDAMVELVRLALQCDATRVVSLLLGPAESYRPLGFLGAPGDHHSASHFDEASHAVATRWMVSQYAALVAALRDTTQDDGRSLLDDTFVLYVSEISTGPDHGYADIPTLLAGRGGGAWAGGSTGSSGPRGRWPSSRSPCSSTTACPARPSGATG